MAPSQYTLPSGFEIICISWGGNIAGGVGIVPQKVHFAAEVAAAGAVHIPQLGPVHPDQEVAIGAGEFPRSFSGAVDAMLRQLVPRREDKPSCRFPQYNILLPASREISPDERRPRSALPVPAWTIQTAGWP